MTSLQRLVAVVWRDADSSASKVTFKLSALFTPSTSPDTIIAALVPVLEAISDASCTQVHCSLVTRLSAYDEPGEQLLATKAILFWRNTSDLIATLIIPGIAIDIPYTDGDNYGVIPDLSPFAALDDFLQAWEAYDLAGVRIDGQLIAAALIA